MSATNYTGLSQTVNHYIQAKSLKVAASVRRLCNYITAKPQPKNTGESVVFRRPVLLQPATTALTEGVTPPAKPLQYQRVTATQQQYGDLIEYTDRVADLATDPAVSDASMLIGRSAGDTEEMVCYGVAKAGTNVYYANGSARNAVNTIVTTTKLSGIHRQLQNSGAMFVSERQKSSASYGTVSVRAAYFAFCHTDCEHDFRGLTNFKLVEDYGAQMFAEDGEIGSIGNYRVITSRMLSPFPDAGGSAGSMKSTSGTYADVYPIIILAQEALYGIPLKGAGSLSPIVIPVDRPEKVDPLGQRGYVGWKGYLTYMRGNELWMARLEVAVTAL